jgi:hypothetical protein
MQAAQRGINDMMKPSVNTARAIVSLADNPNWQEVLKWIDESAVLQSLQNNHKRGEETVIMQGRNLELEDILNYVGKADGYLANAKEARKMEEK